MEPPSKNKPIKPFDDEFRRLNRVLALAPAQKTHVFGRIWKAFAIEELPITLLQEKVTHIHKTLFSRQLIPIWPFNSSVRIELDKLFDHVERIYVECPGKIDILKKLGEIRLVFVAIAPLSRAEECLNCIEWACGPDHDLFEPFPRDALKGIFDPVKVLKNFRCYLINCLAPDDYDPKNLSRHYDKHNEILNLRNRSEQIAADKYVSALASALKTSMQERALFGKFVFCCRGLVPSALGDLPPDQKKLAIGAQRELSYFPSTLTRLTQLTTLRLFGSAIKVFPTVLAQLPALRKFEADSRINLGAIHCLTQVKKIAIGTYINIPQVTANLPPIPHTLLQLTQLTQLNLQQCDVRPILAGLDVFKNLQQLTLRFNRLLELSPAIGALSQLEKLDCSDNLLDTLPDEIGDLGQLKTLSVHDNLLLRSLPWTMAGLSSLKKLYCSEYRFAVLPYSLIACETLESITSVLAIDPWNSTDPTSLREFLFQHKKSPPLVKLP